MYQTRQLHMQWPPMKRNIFVSIDRIIAYYLAMQCECTYPSSRIYYLKQDTTQKLFRVKLMYIYFELKNEHPSSLITIVGPLNNYFFLRYMI